MPDAPEQDARVYLAAERTLLAWIRTGLALMGFGFVVARFGLFLREMAAARGAGAAGDSSAIEQAADAPGHSLWFGVALVAAGVIVNALAAFDHRRIVRALRAGDIEPTKDSRMGVVLALALALLGGAMAVYLISVR